MDKVKDNGISKKTEIQKVRTYLCFGLMAALIAFAADMILGWSTSGNIEGLGNFSKYLGISDVRILCSAYLGLLGISVEGICCFGIFRLIKENDAKLAKIYKISIFGAMILGGLSHMMSCTFVYYLKHMYEANNGEIPLEVFKYSLFFMDPLSFLYLFFFLLLNVVQFIAFVKGKTSYPKWCAIFVPAFGFIVSIIAGLIGNLAWANALSTAWMSIGAVYAFCGLLIMLGRGTKQT